MLCKTIKLCLIFIIIQSCNQDKIQNIPTDVLIRGIKFNSPCDSMEFRARNDIKVHKVKYYNHGIASIYRIAKLDVLSDKYSVEVVNMGCLQDNHSMCYNSIIDSLIHTYQ